MRSDAPTELFSCKMCGECCMGFGGTYVSEAEMAAIARYLQEPPESFAERYCRPSGSRQVLGQADSGYCVFMKDRRCGIHPVKPRMCRAWPFLESVLRDPINWKIMAGVCPGIRGDADPEDVRRGVIAYRRANGLSLSGVDDMDAMGGMDRAASDALDPDALDPDASEQDAPEQDASEQDAPEQDGLK